MKKIKKETEDLIIKDYTEGLTIKMLSSKYFYYQEGIRNILKDSKIYINGQKRRRKYSFNENYFEVIDSPDKAYWLGFLAADGYINQKRKYFAVSASEEDTEILEKLKISLNSNHKIHKVCKITPINNLRAIQHCLNINGEKAVTDLVKLGLVQRKSLILKPPPIETKYILDFMRGYFDGDGGISFHRVKKRNNTLQASISITGTLEICDYFKSFLLQFGFNPLLNKRIKDSSNNYTLLISGNYNSIKFCNLIYANQTLFLQRKYDRYLELLADYKLKHKNRHFLIQKRGQFYCFDFEFCGKRYSRFSIKTLKEAILLCRSKLLELNAGEKLQKFDEINNYPHCLS